MSSSHAKQITNGFLGTAMPRGQMGSSHSGGGTGPTGATGPTGPAGETGATGATGPAGSGTGGETVGQVAFDFNTPSPVLLQAVSSGLVLNRCTIIIVTPFDDPTASIEVGTSADPSLIFAPGEVAAGFTGNTFGNSTLYPFTTNDFLLLTLSPGASTQGSGILLYKAKQE